MELQMEKFRVLGLTDYDRVLYMDADIMARGSMDYLFDLSMQGKLQENIVFAGKTEPANGGTFMLAPKSDSWFRLWCQLLHFPSLWERILHMSHPP